MNAQAPDGRRYAQTYFDPAAPRLTGGPPQALPQVSEPLAPTDAERTDDQAALIRHFDPVHLSLEQIEALQQLLSETAATRRALEHHPEFDPAIPYVPEGQVHHALELGGAEDSTGAYHRGGETEIDWRNLDPEGLAHQAEVDAVIAAMKAEAAAGEKRQPTPRSSRATSRDPARTNPTRRGKAP